MIRVTWFDGKIYEEQNEFNLKYSLNDERVIKVEKQAKDLTKQEIYRYGELRYSEIASIRITEHNIVYAFYSDSDEYYIYSETINNDTYVDITDLVKEQRKYD